MGSRTKLILACLLFVVGAYIVYNPSFLSSFTSISIGGGITGKPTMTATQVDHILCSNGSPACGTGSSLFSESNKYQIDDRYALATFAVESSYGKAGVARYTHGLGNIRCSAGYACYQGFRSYPSWQTGYADFFSLIRNLYVNSWKLASVDAIIPRYAPNNENNSSLYASSVKKLMASYK